MGHPVYDETVTRNCIRYHVNTRILKLKAIFTRGVCCVRDDQLIALAEWRRLGLDSRLGLDAAAY